MFLENEIWAETVKNGLRGPQKMVQNQYNLDKNTKFCYKNTRFQYKPELIEYPSCLHTFYPHV